MKKIKYIAFSVITLFAFSNKVLAAGSVSVNKSQVTVGDSFTVTASISGAATWDVHVSASGPVSGCSIQQAGYTQDLSATSKSWSATCTATGTGTVTVSLSGTTTNDAGATSGISGSRSVTVVAKSSGSGGKTNTNTNNYQPKKTEPTKSSNTKLEEFGVKGYKVNPEFSNGTNSYSLTVPYDTTKITIYASRSSNKQTVTGTGDKEVKTGENKFDIVVTAEDGTKKTISLNIVVDQKPIKVDVDGKEYTVIKKKEELPKLDIEHEDKELNMEEQNVPAYRISNIGYTLIGLQDSEGNKYLYKFKAYKADEKPAEYTLFRYIKAGDIYLIPLDFPKSKIPDNYKEYKEKIGDTEYTVYKLEENSKYSLLYGTNINTNKDNIYKYESSENTLQLYEKNVKKVNNEKYKKLIMILGGVVVFLLLLTTIGFTRKPKDKTFKEKFSKEINEEEDLLSKRDIKKIEKETKKQEKKQKKKQKKGEPEL